MKLVSILAAVLTLVSAAHANASVFTSEDVTAINQSLSVLATGQTAVVDINGAAATCRVNTLAELPGYKCSIALYNGGEIQVSNLTFEAIASQLADKATGQGIVIQALSGQLLLCLNNTMAELPGYKCSLAE